MQKIPSKPAFVLSDEEYQFILERDQSGCALRRNCNGLCDPFLDFDHKHPQALGGDDSFVNLRLLCRSRNRERGGSEPDEKWVATNFWDRPADPTRLRYVQRIPGWHQIEEVTEELPFPAQHLRRVLLSSVTLLPGVTGIGKSLLTLGVFCKFNAVIGPGYPRVKHVLWLCHETNLRDQAREEIENDGMEHGFFSARPIVNLAKDWSQLLHGPQGGDVTVATIQTLWEVRKGEVARRSPSDKRRALAPFDTIIFDECDWGNEQVRGIAQIATHALKLALTATPIVNGDTKKDFINHFALISENAVADFQTAHQWDGCLKALPAEPTVAAGHDAYEGQKEGAAFTNPGHMDRNYVSYLPTILEAVRTADRLETDMRKARHADSDWYSPHVMVRMADIRTIKETYAELQDRLKEWRLRGILENEGWDVTAIFQGCERWGKLSRQEYDLSARFNGRYQHPFMVAKNNNGQATRQSKRILLMCNIGVRGLNNWPISTFVNCSDYWDIVNILQADIGRSLRWPNSRQSWLEDDSLKRFAEISVVVPQGNDTPEYLNAMKAARDFIETMRERIPAMGFLTWRDLASGRRPDDGNVNIDTKARPLEVSEKVRLQSILADMEERGIELTPATIEGVVDSAFYDQPSNVRIHLTDYGKKLVDKPEFRLAEMTSGPTLDRNRKVGIEVMARLLPQDKFDVGFLLRWAKEDSSLQPIYADIEEALTKVGDKSRIFAEKLISERIRNAQRDTHRYLDRRHRLHGEDGILPSLAKELASELYNARISPADRGAVPRCVNAAAKALYGVDSAEEGQALDNPAYHMAILLEHRTRIQRIAYGMLVESGQLGASLQRFSTQRKGWPT